jgi:hypothetical protein
MWSARFRQRNEKEKVQNPAQALRPLVVERDSESLTAKTADPWLLGFLSGDTGGNTVPDDVELRRKCLDAAKGLRRTMNLFEEYVALYQCSPGSARAVLNDNYRSVIRLRVRQLKPYIDAYRACNGDPTAWRAVTDMVESGPWK